MGSSKGAGEAAPPPQAVSESTDNTAAMMAMMQMSMMQNAQNQQQPQMPEVPTSRQAPLIDWSKKQDQLAAKAKADYRSDQSRTKGRDDTILTGSLLDDEEVTTTTSILSGA